MHISIQELQCDFLLQTSTLLQYLLHAAGRRNSQIMSQIKKSGDTMKAVTALFETQTIVEIREVEASLDRFK